MKKTIYFRQIFSFLLIAFFLAACSFEKNLAVNSNSPKNLDVTISDDGDKVLSLCDLGNDPSKFDGKIVRLKTRLTFGTENDTFSDEKCSYSAVVNYESKNAYDPIIKMRKKGSDKGVTVFYADVEVEGKFINKPFTGCCTKTPFQFEITKTYTAQPVKPN